MPTGLVEEKALVWFFHALENYTAIISTHNLPTLGRSRRTHTEGPAVSRRIAIEDILEDIASKKDRRGHSKGWLFDRVQRVGLTGVVDPNALAIEPIRMSLICDYSGSFATSGPFSAGKEPSGTSRATRILLSRVHGHSKGD